MKHDADEWDPLARGLNALEATQLSMAKNVFELLITVLHAHVVRMEDNSAYESEQAIGTLRLKKIFNWENPQNRYTMLTLRKIIYEKFLLHVRISMRIW